MNDYKYILNKVRKSNPNKSYRDCQKYASYLHKSHKCNQLKNPFPNNKKYPKMLKPKKFVKLSKPILKSKPKMFKPKKFIKISTANIKHYSHQFKSYPKNEGFGSLDLKKKNNRNTIKKFINNFRNKLFKDSDFYEDELNKNYNIIENIIIPHLEFSLQGLLNNRDIDDNTYLSMEQLLLTAYGAARQYNNIMS